MVFPMSARQKSSIATEEIEHFSHYAGEWWNPDGPLRPLHRLNPVRIAYVRDRIIERGLGAAKARHPLKSLSILDVGCGGGLLSEPLSRLGAHVTGLDASSEAIEEARRHAKAAGVKINYLVGSVEELAESFSKRRKNSPPLGEGLGAGLSVNIGPPSEKYDVITALEIVEHVADLDTFLAALAKLLKPNGLLILSTLNRTPKSFLFGIIAAEYILRWVPRGTHRWSKFLRPSELVRKLAMEGLTTADLTGIVYHPLGEEFLLSKTDLGVNYMLTAAKS
jgi:2-polyprenyl-6-hydroxyphenyl methylase / 3-demethylubiquinone-9 3-methyltransferase